MTIECIHDLIRCNPCCVYTPGLSQCSPRRGDRVLRAQCHTGAVVSSSHRMPTLISRFFGCIQPRPTSSIAAISEILARHGGDRLTVYLGIGISTAKCRRHGPESQSEEIPIRTNCLGPITKNGEQVSHLSSTYSNGANESLQSPSLAPPGLCLRVVFVATQRTLSHGVLEKAVQRPQRHRRCHGGQCEPDFRWQYHLRRGEGRQQCGRDVSGGIWGSSRERLSSRLRRWPSHNPGVEHQHDDRHWHLLNA